MPVSRQKLKDLQQDYFLASWEDGELIMEPFCSCGSSLGEDNFCQKCNRECKCDFIACSDPQALSVAEKLIAGNPNFKDFNTSLLQ
jgi:hypothetical protein